MITMGVFEDNGVKWFPPQPKIELEGFQALSEAMDRVIQEEIDREILIDFPHPLQECEFVKVDWNKEGF